MNMESLNVSWLWSPVLELDSTYRWRHRPLATQMEGFRNSKSGQLFLKYFHWCGFLNWIWYISVSSPWSHQKHPRVSSFFTVKVSTPRHIVSYSEFLGFHDFLSDQLILYCHLILSSTPLKASALNSDATAISFLFHTPFKIWLAESSHRQQMGKQTQFNLLPWSLGLTCCRTEKGSRDEEIGTTIWSQIIVWLETPVLIWSKGHNYIRLAPDWHNYYCQKVILEIT